PPVRPEQRVGRPNRHVREPPPALRQAERDVDPPLRLGHLNEEQQPARLEQRPHVRQRLAEIRRRVQDVDRQHNIVPARLEALLPRVPLDVQQLVPDEVVRRESLPRPRQEHRRDVREHVLRPVPRQHRQHRRRRPTRARANLDDPEPRALRTTRQRRPHHVRDETVERPRQRRFPIQPLRELRRATREQQRERIHRPGQRTRELPPALPRQPDLRIRGRVPLEELPPRRLRIARPRRTERPPPIPRRFQHPPLGQDLQEPVQEPAVPRQHPPPLRRFPPREPRARREVPAEPQDRLLHERAAHRLQPREELLVLRQPRRLREPRRAIRDRRLELRRRRPPARRARLTRNRLPTRSLPPVDLVQPPLVPVLPPHQIVDEPPQREPPQLRQDPPGVVQDTNVRHQRVAPPTRT